MSEELVIRDHRIAPGERRQADVRIARLPTRTAIEIPVLVDRAEEPGPVLLLTAGLHGDELNGVLIIRRLISEGHLAPTRGTVVAIPLLNVFGFLYQARDLPDGKDLNRQFPGSRRGSLASRIAYFLSNEVVPLSDYILDFHTGGGKIHNFPQIRCRFDSPGTLEFARTFEAPFLLNSRLKDGSFRKQAHEQGTPLLIYEGGEALHYDEFAIEQGVQGTLRIMRDLGMVETSESPPSDGTVELRRSTWIRAQHSGLFHPSIPNGSRVTSQQTLGLITDPYGSFEKAVRTRKDGFVLAINNNPTVNRGDALLHIGYQREN